MSLLRNLARAVLNRLDDGQSERGQGRAQLMLPPPRTELGFPNNTTMQSRPLQARPVQPLYAELMQRYEAPPPMVVPPPAPPRRRRKKTVTVTEEIFYRRG